MSRITALTLMMIFIFLLIHLKHNGRPKLNLQVRRELPTALLWRTFPQDLDFKLSRRGNKTEILFPRVRSFNSVITSPSNGRVGNMLSAYSSMMVNHDMSIEDIISLIFSTSNFNMGFIPSWPGHSSRSSSTFSKERKCPSQWETSWRPRTWISSGRL